MNSMIKIAAIAAGAALAVFGGFLGVRYGLASLRAQATASLPRLTSLGATRSLTITPVYEADARDGFAPGRGVSYLIQTDDTRVLMDFGNGGKGEPLVANMARLGVDLGDIDAFVISHNHPDHLGGNAWWLRSTFAVGESQPDLAGKRVVAPAGLSYPGATLDVADLPTVLGRGIASMGTIAYVEPPPLSMLAPSGAEQALAVHVDGVGVVVISGCGHPGLARMLERADALFDAPVAGFIGGLHKADATAAEAAADIALLAQRQPRIVALSPHDSGPEAIAAFTQAFGAAYRDLAAGGAIHIPGE